LAKKVIIIQEQEVRPNLPERDTNRHHRKPRSKGGKSSKGNISRVNPRAHKAWHYFFNNRNGTPMDTLGIAKKLPHFYSMLESLFMKDPSTRTLKTLEEFVKEGNELWFDPSYTVLVNNETTEE
jgi:hypothetical protein